MRRRHYSVLGMHNRSKRYACVYLVSVLLTFKHSMHGDKLVVGTPPPGNLRECKSKHKNSCEFPGGCKLHIYNPVLVVTVDTVKALKC